MKVKQYFSTLWRICFLKNFLWKEIDKNKKKVNWIVEGHKMNQ